MNRLDQLKTAFFEFLHTTFSLSPEQTARCEFMLNVDPDKQQFGDINSNSALILSKQLGRNPPEIAQEIANTFTHELVERIEIAGPGFLNLFLTTDAFAQLAQELREHPHEFFKPTPSEVRENYSLEFVSANPTGPLHLGHGRGGIIGDVLGNVLKFLGHRVTREFYINNAGAQIQKLGQSFKIRCQQALGQDVELPETAYQGKYLQELAQTFVKKQGKAVLEKPDEFFADYAVQQMLENVKKTLAAYRVDFDVWFSEKSLHESGAVEKEIKKLTAAGHTYEHDGALWFKATAFGDDKDRVLRRANGVTTYAAADIAYLQDKIDRGHTKLIMILGQDHHSYKARLEGLLQAMGHDPATLDVILYQLVSIKSGGAQLRMSKRAGRMVTLTEIIELVGADVARFFYLHRKADAHLEFDLDLALKHTEENPVYYVQYAFVRINSILGRAKQHPELQEATIDPAQLGPDERLLLKKICALKDVLGTIAGSYQTHMLAYYATELANAFHRYYAHSRVVEPSRPERSRTRLALVQVLHQTLALCLDLLKLSKPAQM